jgi:hypothetical protein
VLAFVLILVARFPAAWAQGALPKDLSCDEVDGTVWNGSCNGLMLQHQQLIGDLAWQLHPARLLAGCIAAHVQMTQAGGSANGDVELGFGGRIEARALHANVRLNPRLIPQLPASLSGSALVDLALLEVKGGRVTNLVGRIEAHDLEEASGAVTPLGSYALSFAGAAPGGALTGTLIDLGGPLAVAGTLRMTPEPGFVLEGTVASRANATPELARQLQMLGAPDAQGRRSFSIANTF